MTTNGSVFNWRSEVDEHFDSLFTVYPIQINGWSATSTRLNEIYLSLSEFRQEAENLLIYVLQKTKNHDFLSFSRATTEVGIMSMRWIDVVITQDLDSVLTLVVKNYGYSVNTIHPISGNTLLMIAVCNSSQTTVKQLIDLGADVMIKNNKGSTALHKACRYGSLSTVKMILEKISDPVYVNTVDNKGRTPLDMLLPYSNDDEVIEIAKILLLHGADINLCAYKAGTLFKMVGYMHENMCLEKRLAEKDQENNRLKGKIEFLWWRPGGPGFEECQTRFETGSYDVQTSDSNTAAPHHTQSLKDFIASDDNMV